MAAYASIAETRGSALADTILRARSFEGRDLLAFVASGGECDYVSLIHKADGDCELDRVNLERLGQLARVVAVQEILPDDRAVALWLFEEIDFRLGTGAFSPELGKIFGELMLLEGQIDDLKSRLPALKLEADDQTIIETDLVNPFAVHDRDTDDFALSNWCRKFTAAMGFHPDSVSAIAVDPKTIGSPFDGLRANTHRGRGGNHLVSVIVTTFRPSHSLPTAIKSLIRQTWQNLEILLVDDGSPGEFAAVLEEAVELDNRIRLLSLPSNVGTYAARNEGLAAARGEFITFQDSDDWSHPERVERQLQPLLDRAGLVSTTSTYVRTDENLALVRIGYPLHRPNVSSLMIRSTVVERVGFMDSVRKGADAEYLRRIQTVYPDGHYHLDPPALAVVRSVVGSLSHGEARAGWHHSGRFAYRSAFDDWHREIAAGASPYVEKGPHIRPFPAPSSYTDDRVVGKFDVVVVADWRPRDGSSGLVNELEQLAHQGLRVGYAHVESFRHMSKRRREQLTTPLRELQRSGKVGLVLLDDVVDIELLVVRDPTVLQFPPYEPADWTASGVILITSDDGQLERFFVAEDVEERAQRAFERHVIWLKERTWRQFCRKPKQLRRFLTKTAG